MQRAIGLKPGVYCKNQDIKTGGYKKSEKGKIGPSCSFTAEFIGPFLVSLQVFGTDCWPGAADRFDKVF